MGWQMLVLGALTLTAAIIWVGRRRFWVRDEIYSGVTPGLVPLGESPPVEHTQHIEYNGPIAVAFTPPKNATPGLVGVIVDGRVDPRDLTATIIDLAARGHLRIEVIEGDRKDWTLTATGADRGGLLGYERHLLKRLFRQSNQVVLSQVSRQYPEIFTQTTAEMYRHTQAIGWYRDDPAINGTRRRARWAVGGVFGAILTLGMFPTSIGWTAALCFFAAAAVGLFDPGARVPRTAAGTAAQIQSLGFRQYLATAEAHQIKFEEAASIFNRYLPYAVVFGVADHWAKVFRDLAVRADAEGVTLDMDLGWYFAAEVGVHAASLFIEMGGIEILADGMGEFLGALDGLQDVVGDVVGGILDSIDIDI